MSEVLSMVELSSLVHEALIERKGKRGEVLQCVLAYEQGDWEGVGHLGLDHSTLQKSYFDSLAWMGSLMPLLKE